MRIIPVNDGIFYFLINKNVCAFIVTDKTWKERKLINYFLKSTA